MRNGGAPAYLAPEVMKRAAPGVALDYGKSDVWAAGLLLYELLAGQVHVSRNVRRTLVLPVSGGMRSVVCGRACVRACARARARVCVCARSPAPDMAWLNIVAR